MITVHILYEGLPLCGFSTAVLGEWPKGHKWVTIDDEDDLEDLAYWLRVKAVDVKRCSQCEARRDKLGPWQIIDTDNFGGDYPNETFIATGIAYKPFAECMCEALNAKYSGNTSLRMYLVVGANYKLQPGFEP